MISKSAGKIVYTWNVNYRYFKRRIKSKSPDRNTDVLKISVISVRPLCVHRVLFVPVLCFVFCRCLHTVQRDVRRRGGIPAPAGAVPEQRRDAAAGRAVRRAGQTGGRANVPGGRVAVSQAAAGAERRRRHVRLESVGAVVAVFYDVRPGRADQAGRLPVLSTSPSESPQQQQQQ